MTAEITVPALGESITEATVARWLKSVGDAVDVDEPVVELETDKVTVEVNAPLAGTLGEILVGEGANVEIATGDGRRIAQPGPYGAEGWVRTGQREQVRAADHGIRIRRLRTGPPLDHRPEGALVEIVDASVAHEEGDLV